MSEAITYERIQVRPLTGVMGAEIRGVDLRKSLDDATWSEIQQAFYRHLVIYFPDQPVSGEQHVAFSRRFGELTTAHLLPFVDGFDNLQMVRREATDSGRVVGENWHTDGSYLERPYSAVVMRAVDVPPVGGDTAFLNMYTAYEMLSPKMREVIDGLKGVHSGTRIFGSGYRKHEKKFDAGQVLVDQASIDEGDREVAHPLVRTHEGTGRKFLYINQLYVQRIEGMTEAESQPLIRFLCDHASRFEFTCRVRWARDQLLVWDNRVTMHKAISDYSGDRRLMHRATVAGARTA